MMLSTAAISLCACFSSLVSGVDNVFMFTFVGFNKAAACLVLCIPCVLLCKNCLAGIQRFFPNDKIRLENAKRRMVELFSADLVIEG